MRKIVAFAITVILFLTSIPPVFAQAEDGPAFGPAAARHSVVKKMVKKKVVKKAKKKVVKKVIKKKLKKAIRLQAKEPPIQTTPQAVMEEHIVEIKDFAFSPAIMTVRKGETVKFVQKDSAPHNVMSDNGQPAGFRSEMLSNVDESYSFTFNEVGDLSYFCGVHPNMTGRIVVGE